MRSRRRFALISSRLYFGGRLLERVARLIGVVENACDEWDVVDIVDCNGPVLEARSVVLHEESESACTEQRLRCFVPGSGELGWVSRILDDVASFCFDGYDALLRVT